MHNRYRFSRLARHWQLVMHYGAQARETAETWSSELQQLTNALRPSQSWLIVNRDAAPLTDDLAGQLASHVQAAGQGGVDEHQPLYLMSADESGIWSCAIRCDFEIGEPAPHGNWLDLMWPQSTVSITFFSSLDANAHNLLVQHMINACGALKPHWAYLYGQDGTMLWPVPGATGMAGMLANGGIESGIPQLGWLTFLRSGQFPEVPATLPGGHVRSIPGGQLLEVAKRPWKLDDREAVDAYLDMRQALLSQGVIRPAADAAAFLKPHWATHEVQPSSLIPTDADEHSLRVPDPNAQVHETDELDDGEFDDDDIDLNQPGAPPLASPEEGMTSTTTLGDAELAAALETGGMPFQHGVGARAPGTPALLPPSAPLPPNEDIGSTTNVSDEEIAAIIGKLPAPTQLPMSLHDYAGLVAYSEADKTGERRAQIHQNYKVDSEAHRTAIDQTFLKLFQQSPKAWADYNQALAKWKLWLKEGR